MTIQKQLVVGLTGGIASGKTTAADYLATLGAHLVDTDVIARQVVAPHSPTTLAIAELLGQDFLHADGNLNRAKIKQCIFTDAGLKSRYEGIILPAIRRATLAQLDNAPNAAPYIVLIVPLLFEKGLDAHCHCTVAIDVAVPEQIRRGTLRNASDRAIIQQVIDQQMPRAQRNARADYVIDNSTTQAHLYQQLDTLHHTLCRR